MEPTTSTAAAVAAGADADHGGRGGDADGVVSGDFIYF